jgi:hypothetical protein
VEKQWYLSRGDRRLGPFAIGKLRQLAAAGKLAKEDRLCELGTLEWRMAGDLEELFPKPAPVAIVAATPVETVVRSLSAMDAAAGVNARLDEYLHWRWLRCLILLPVAVVAMAFFVYNMIQFSDEDMSQLGRFVRMAVPMSHIGLALGAAVGLLFHSRFREAAFGMLLGCGLAFLVPMALAFLPIASLAKIPPANNMDVARMVSALGAMLTTLVFLLLPLGALSGAARVRRLIPEDEAAGWLMLASAMLLGFNSLCGSIISLQYQSLQLHGSPWPLVGFAMLTAAPLVLLVDWKQVLRCAPESADSQPTRNVIWFDAMLGVGALVLILSLCTVEAGGRKLVGFDPETSHIRPWHPAVWQAVFSFSASALAATILFADGVFALAVAHWRLGRPFHASREAEECEREFEELARSM